MNPALPLPAPAKLTPTLDATGTLLRSLLGTRSKTIKIPTHVRDKMKSFQSVAEFWNGAAGQKLYAALLEEQKQGAKPKTKTAAG